MCVTQAIAHRCGNYVTLVCCTAQAKWEKMVDVKELDDWEAQAEVLFEDTDIWYATNEQMPIEVINRKTNLRLSKGQKLVGDADVFKSDLPQVYISGECLLSFSTIV
jgi:hypothetical protein